MFATVRRYAGMSEATIAEICERADDISNVLASVPGSRGAHLIRTRDGLILVTTGADEPSLVESGRRVRAWLDDQVSEFRTAGEADVWSGPVLFQDDVWDSPPMRRPT
jgi:hypothetical protein